MIRINDIFTVESSHIRSSALICASSHACFSFSFQVHQHKFNATDK